MTKEEKVKRLRCIVIRLNEIWYDGGPAGGEIQQRYKKEFESLLEEEATLRDELFCGA